MINRKKWNDILNLLAKTYDETRDERIAGLHAMVMGYALEDHERETGFNYND